MKVDFNRFVGASIVLAIFFLGTFIRTQTWQIQAKNLRTIQFVQSNMPNDFLPPFRFEEKTKELGISFQYEMPIVDSLLQNKSKIFLPTGAGVAVADFNGDGWMDILLVNSKKNSKNHLYLNQNGSFFKEEAQTWKIADTNLEGATITPVAFDFDNDGKPDVFLARLGCSMLFRNTGRGFEDVSQRSGISDCKNSVGAVPVDFNHDGLLDLYVLRYWNSYNYFMLNTPYVAPENFFNALNGGSNTLYKNIGGGKFLDVTQEQGGYDSHWSLDAAAADFTGNGQLDLLISNDFGPDTLFHIQNNQLTNESFRIGPPDRRPGMGVALGDLTNDGTPHVYVSNAYLAEYQQTGNFLWKFNQQRYARDEAPYRKVDKCGWSWGALFSDFDLDGKEDLYVTNGFITDVGETEYEDYEDLLEKNYAFSEGTVMSLPGKLASDVRIWPSLKQKSLAGHEVDCLFYNQGSEFKEVSALVGIQKEWDGRAVAAIDYDNNGSIDLIVTTQNGPPHLLKNTVVPNGKWISFTLEGTLSNRDGAGARIQVIQDHQSRYRWATAGKTGFLASSDPRLHFGLPKAGFVDVEIDWPSGVKQKIPKLETGRNHHIIETAENAKKKKI